MTPPVNRLVISLLGRDRSRIRSLKDVLPVQVHLYTDSLNGIALQYGTATLFAATNTPLPDNVPQALKERVATVLVFAEECKLTQSIWHCNEVLRVLEKYPNDPKHVKTALDRLLVSFAVDTNAERYFHMPADAVKLYLASPEDEFTAQVCKRFPNAKRDLWEALGCLAMDKGTECVFRLHRALEVCIRGVWRSLICASTPTTEKHKGGMGKYIGDIRGFLKNNMGQQKFSDWSDREEFYDEIGYFVPAIRTIRNAVAHPGRDYTPSEAKAVKVAATAMMVHIAKRITQSGKYTG